MGAVVCYHTKLLSHEEDNSPMLLQAFRLWYNIIDQKLHNSLAGRLR